MFIYALFMCLMYVYTYNVHMYTDILIHFFFYSFGLDAGQILDNTQKTAAS